MIKGKTPEEIRKTFNIKNDFTEEEEAQVKQALVSCLSPVLHAVMRFTHQNVVFVAGTQGEPVVWREVKILTHFNTMDCSKKT